MYIMSLNSAISQNIRNSFKTDAKGLEKIIFKSSFFIASTANYLNTLFYGKGEPKSKGNKTRFSNPIDLGVIPLLDVVNSVDVCNLLNYGIDKLSNVKTGKKFDPTKKPDTPFGKVKWRFQKTAFDVQAIIDGFYNDYEEVNTEDSKIGVLVLLTKIRNFFSGFTSALTGGPIPQAFSEIDPDIRLLIDAFPELKSVGNYINDKLSYYDRYTDPNQLATDDVKKILDTIKKIRQYCVLIQSLDEPAAALTQLGSSLFAKDLNSLSEKIDFTNIIPTLKKINNAIKKTISVCQKINNIINTSRLLIRIFLLLIKVFKIIINYLTVVPLSNMFTTVGVTNKFSDSVKTVKEKGPTTFEARIKQIVVLLETVSMLITSLLPMLTDALSRINTLIANIERCDNPPLDLVNEMKENTQELQNIVSSFEDFLNTKKQNDLTRSNDTQFGEYTIQIITEEVVEEAISIRRRYGVALNNRGIVTVSSQPTFASDDLIIINEVKLLLRQLGVKVELDRNYTQSELDLLNDASAYLVDNDINLDLNSSSDLDSANDANEFVGGIRGGRRFKARARARMARERATLQERLRGG
jgi:hypothetical protein